MPRLKVIKLLCKKAYGEWRCSSTNLNLGSRWGCGQLDAPAILNPGQRAADTSCIGG